MDHMDGKTGATVAKAAVRTLKMYVFVNSAVFFGSVAAAIVHGAG